MGVLGEKCDKQTEGVQESIRVLALWQVVKNLPRGGLALPPTSDYSSSGNSVRPGYSEERKSASPPNLSATPC